LTGHCSRISLTEKHPHRNWQTSKSRRDPRRWRL
jgi:hypothetical protein